jgi:NAD+ diphosphatase
MIQDIGSHQLNHYYSVQPPQNRDKVYLFQGRNVLLDTDGEMPEYQEIKNIAEIEYRFLFHVDEKPYFLGISQNPVTLEGYSYQPARSFRHLRPMERALSGFTAMHLNSWYSSNQFCGRCGHKMEVGRDERKMVCPHCKNMVYPRLNPAVIVAVTDGDKLLMTKYSDVHRVRHFVLVAGFVEIGETAEQTVAREVLEETGVHVKNIRYFGSQPWGCDGNLTLGYFADLDGDAHITLDKNELSAGQWFERKDVPIPDDDVSITSEMIHRFAAGQEPK